MFKELFTEAKDLKKVQKELLQGANKVAKKVTLQNEYVKFDGLEDGKVGVILDSDSDANNWDRAPQYIIYDSNTDTYEISTTTNETITLSGNASAIWSRFEDAFYSEKLGIGGKNLKGKWK
jgi:hypothetical protein